MMQDIPEGVPINLKNFASIPVLLEFFYHCAGEIVFNVFGKVHFVCVTNV